jgi:hypothetical protein
MMSWRVNEGGPRYIRLGVSYFLLQRLISLSLSNEILRDPKSRWIQTVSWPPGSAEISVKSVRLFSEEFIPREGFHFYFLLYEQRESNVIIKKIEVEILDTSIKTKILNRKT